MKQAVKQSNKQSVSRSINQPIKQWINHSISQSVSPQSINQSINQAMNQSFEFKHFQTDAGGALPANLFPLGSWIIVALRQLRLYGGLVNRSKSLTAFKTIDGNSPCLRFSGRGSPLSRSSWAWNFKSSCSKVRYHSIGKQRHVWSRSEFDRGGPACSSGASRKGPCRQGCNLTASQHSFEMSFLRMAVAMPHLVLHKKDQMMWSLDVQTFHERLHKPEQPKSGWTLSDCPIDTVLLL